MRAVASLPIRKPRLQKKNKSTLKAQRKTGWAYPACFFTPGDSLCAHRGLQLRAAHKAKLLRQTGPGRGLRGGPTPLLQQLSGQPHILGMHQAQTRCTARVEQAVFIDQALLGLRTGTRGAVYLAIGLHRHTSGVFSNSTNTRCGPF